MKIRVFLNFKVGGRTSDIDVDVHETAVSLKARIVAHFAEQGSDFSEHPISGIVIEGPALNHQRLADHETIADKFDVTTLNERNLQVRLLTHDFKIGNLLTASHASFWTPETHYMDSAAVRATVVTMLVLWNQADTSRFLRNSVRRLPLELLFAVFEQMNKAECRRTGVADIVPLKAAEDDGFICVGKNEEDAPRSRGPRSKGDCSIQ